MAARSLIKSAAIGQLPPAAKRTYSSAVRFHDINPLRDEGAFRLWILSRLQAFWAA
jgi:hypothetical protein